MLPSPTLSAHTRPMIGAMRPAVNGVLPVA